MAPSVVQPSSPAVALTALVSRLCRLSAGESSSAPAGSASASLPSTSSAMNLSHAFCSDTGVPRRPSP